MTQTNSQPQDDALMAKYANTPVLVMGGTGFIGSNLVIELLRLGADVTILSRGETQQAISFSEPVKSVRLDISTTNPASVITLRDLVSEAEVIFDLAGRSGAVSSTHGPYHDLQSNVIGQYNLLETCRLSQTNAHIVFVSSRLVYGKAQTLPVAENHPTEPTSIYGINRLTAEKYHQLYAEIHGVKTSILRATIPYGPLAPTQKYSHGIVNLFSELVAADQSITLYGHGTQLRDVIFIDDLTAALLRVPMHEETNGQIYNLGTGEGVSLATIADTACKITGKGSINNVDWPNDALQVETGDFYSSIDKIKSHIDWEPRTSLEEGLIKTVSYYLKDGSRLQ